MRSVEAALPAGGPGGRGGSRGADRRSTMAALLAALAAHVQAGRDQGALRAEFEGRLRQALRLKAVRLREESAVYGAAAPPPEPTGERVCLEVPTRAAWPRVRLEARSGPGSVLDAWGFQLLGMAAHLAALLVDLDRRGPSVHRAAVGLAGDEPPPLVGSSEVMRALRERITRIAATDFTVLVEGESGTGKELVARQLHALSRRRHGPFIAVNCAAIVETLLEAELFGIEERTATGVRGRRGKFEHADGGTLFLDEVADLAPAAQAKLLRAIQELSVERVGGHTSRRVDARIVVATNRSLRELVRRGAFREDLYYRLSGVELHVPPLRTRREDVALLAMHFLARYGPVRPYQLAPDAIQALSAYDWPGNVRELERTLEGALTAARSEVIHVDDLPADVTRDFCEIVGPSLARGDTLRAWACRYAHLVLDKCAGNKRQACVALGISYHTLRSYLAESSWAQGSAEDDEPDARGRTVTDTTPVAAGDDARCATSAGG
jgi:DNA-binding NtrC family response regulator